jgi:twitching motility protein PilT
VPFINLGKQSPKTDNSVMTPITPPSVTPPTPSTPRTQEEVPTNIDAGTTLSFESSDTDNMVANGQVGINLGENVQVKQTEEIKEVSMPPVPPAQPVKELPKSDPSASLDAKLQAMSAKPLSANVGVLSQVTSGLENKTYSLVDFMQEAIAKNASDLHITPGYRAMARINGELININSPIITPEDTKIYATELLKNRKDSNLDSINEFDLTYSLEGRRFRVNIFRQMGTFAIAARVISDTIPTIDELGLPAITKEFSKYPNGLVLVTGPTGSGKSTTIASMLNLVNTTSTKHIITLEDPVEYIFPKALSLIDQREFGMDFSGWPNALRAILRQDPNIVLVGEMRDLDTVESALRIAETGHLVFATLHTNSASQTIDRIIDMFPAEKQEQIKVQLSSVLQAVISQRLVRTIQEGRVAAQEILIANSAVRNTIRESKGIQLDNIIQTSADLGMFSLEKSLAELVKTGKITAEVGKLTSNRPNDFEILLNRS